MAESRCTIKYKVLYTYQRHSIWRYYPEFPECREIKHAHAQTEKRI